MKEFIGGVCLSVVVTGLIVAVWLGRRRRRTAAGPVEASDFDGELAQLTGELAHELKNPLSTIKVNLTLIREALDDIESVAGSEDQRHRLAGAMRKIAVVGKEADRLDRILDGFLRYVRSPELQFEKADLNVLVGDMVDFYSPQARSHSLTVRQSLADGPLIGRVDPVALKQVLLNLFINAQQAMDNGGELMIRTFRRGGLGVIHVSDTGKGIAPERLPAIFQPYQSSRAGGTGLGLATAKKIVQAHSGTITVHSELGKGTAFAITLPLANEDANSDEAAK